MTPELQAHIAQKKVSNEIQELAKAAINLAGNTDSSTLLYVLNDVMEQGIEFGKLFIRAAKIYATENPFVDLRMESGKEMLIAISDIELVESDNKSPLELPPIPEYRRESYEQSGDLKERFVQLVEFSSKDEDSLELAADALYKALRFQHPTLTQSFLGCFRNAAQTVQGNGYYLTLANAYSKPLPFV